jgi:hypothetical protein
MSFLFTVDWNTENTGYRWYPGAKQFFDFAEVHGSTSQICGVTA